MLWSSACQTCDDTNLTVNKGFKPQRWWMWNLFTRGFRVYKTAKLLMGVRQCQCRVYLKIVNRHARLQQKPLKQANRANNKLHELRPESKMCLSVPLINVVKDSNVNISFCNIILNNRIMIKVHSNRHTQIHFQVTEMSVFLNFIVSWPLRFSFGPWWILVLKLRNTVISKHQKTVKIGAIWE